MTDYLIQTIVFLLLIDINFIQISLSQSDESSTIYRQSKKAMNEVWPNCGKVHPDFDDQDSYDSYVAGGYTARSGQFPSFVRVMCKGSYDVKKGRFRKDETCGGTIITDRLVLTAAHCVICDSFLYVLTSHNRSQVETKNQVKQYCVSSKYVFKVPSRYDIAVVRLAHPIKFNNYIQPACLSSETPDLDERVVAVGMGYMDDYGHIADVLQYLPVKRFHCMDHDYHRTHICYISYVPGHIGDTCHGDSGGPLYATRNGRLVAVGITNYGPARCEAGQQGYSVNGDIAKLRTEISNLIEECLNPKPNSPPVPEAFIPPTRRPPPKKRPSTKRPFKWSDNVEASTSWSNRLDSNEIANRNKRTHDGRQTRKVNERQYEIRTWPSEQDETELDDTQDSWN